MEMELSNLYYFYVVAQTENITKAAQMLHISQPALSTAIGKLEKNLGVSLFLRQNGRIVLSPAGKRFYVPIKHAFDYVQEGAAVLAAIKQEQNHAISVATSSRGLLSTPIAEFLQLHPEMDAKITQDLCTPPVMQERLLDGTFDFCVTPVPLNKREIEQTKLAEEEILLCVSRSHPLAGQKLIGLAELGGESFLVDESNFDSKIVVDHCKVLGLTPHIKLTSYESDSILSALQTNQGICLLPASICRGLPPDKFHLLRIRDIELIRFISITKKKDTILSKTSSMLYNHIEQYYAQFTHEIAGYVASTFPAVEGRVKTLFRDLLETPPEGKER